MTDIHSKRNEDEPSTSGWHRSPLIGVLPTETAQTSSPPQSERVSYAQLRSRFGRRVGVLSKDDIQIYFDSAKSDFRPIADVKVRTGEASS